MGLENLKQTTPSYPKNKRTRIRKQISHRRLSPYPTLTKGREAAGPTAAAGARRDSGTRDVYRDFEPRSHAGGAVPFSSLPFPASRPCTSLGRFSPSSAASPPPDPRPAGGARPPRPPERRREGRREGKSEPEPDPPPRRRRSAPAQSPRRRSAPRRALPGRRRKVTAPAAGQGTGRGWKAPTWQRRRHYGGPRRATPPLGTSHLPPPAELRPPPASSSPGPGGGPRAPLTAARGEAAAAAGELCPRRSRRCCCCRCRRGCNKGLPPRRAAAAAAPAPPRPHGAGPLPSAAAAPGAAAASAAAPPPMPGPGGRLPAALRSPPMPPGTRRGAGWRCRSPLSPAPPRPPAEPPGPAAGQRSPEGAHRDPSAGLSRLAALPAPAVRPFPAHPGSPQGTGSLCFPPEEAVAGANGEAPVTRVGGRRWSVVPQPHGPRVGQFNCEKTTASCVRKYFLLAAISHVNTSALPPGASR
ncbi:basic proline-rich protein-like [Vidua chalybeata]|uniref:basic proline-rich protein-like n=1 Tax=Vidua chalybeata TaxID=81927 RepID=UPI0023A8A9CD|nr:basic proline-rich protein-like [Vidua chalybeata]